MSCSVIDALRLGDNKYVGQTNTSERTANNVSVCLCVYISIIAA